MSNQKRQGSGRKRPKAQGWLARTLGGFFQPPSSSDSPDPSLEGARLLYEQLDDLVVSQAGWFFRVYLSFVPIVPIDWYRELTVLYVSQRRIGTGRQDHANLIRPQLELFRGGLSDWSHWVEEAINRPGGQSVWSALYNQVPMTLRSKLLAEVVSQPDWEDHSVADLLAAFPTRGLPYLEVLDSYARRKHQDLVDPLKAVASLAAGLDES